MEPLNTETRALKDNIDKLDHQSKKDLKIKKRQASGRIGSMILSKIFKNYYIDKLDEESQENFIEEDSGIDMKDINLNDKTPHKGEQISSIKYTPYNMNLMNSNSNTKGKFLDSNLNTPQENKLLYTNKTNNNLSNTNNKSRLKPGKHIKSKTETKIKLNFDSIPASKDHSRQSSYLYNKDGVKKQSMPLNTKKGMLMHSRDNSNIRNSCPVLPNDPNKKKVIKFGPISTLIFETYLENQENDSLLNKYKSTLELELLHNQLLLNSVMQALIAFFTIMLSILNYQDNLDDTDLKTKRSTYITTSFNFLLTIILILTIIFEYFLYSRVLGITYNIPPWIVRKKFINIVQLIFIIILNLIHPNPFLVEVDISYYIQAYDATIYYKLNSIFAVILMIRVFYIYKVVLYSSKFYVPRIDRIANMSGINLDTFFSFKALMLYKSYLCYPLLLIMFLLFGTFGIVVAESPAQKLNDVNFSSYWNAFWCMMITILTVGYGDFYARTVFGRIITIITAFGGTFLLSMLVATFSSIFTFSESEFSICLLINRTGDMKDKEKFSCDLVTEFFHLKKIMKEYKEVSDKINSNNYNSTDKDKNNTNNNTNNTDGPQLSEITKVLKKEKYLKSKIHTSKSELVNKNFKLRKTLEKIKESYRVAEGSNDYFTYQTTQIQNTLEQLTSKFAELSQRFEKLDLKVDNDSVKNEIKKVNTINNHIQKFSGMFSFDSDLRFKMKNINSENNLVEVNTNNNYIDADFKDLYKTRSLRLDLYDKQYKDEMNNIKNYCFEGEVKKRLKNIFGFKGDNTGSIKKINEDKEDNIDTNNDMNDSNGKKENKLNIIENNDNNDSVVYYDDAVNNINSNNKKSNDDYNIIENLDKNDENNNNTINENNK